MQKIILLALFAFTINTLMGQEEIDFKVEYLPNHRYTNSQFDIKQMRLTYIASEEILQLLEERGIANPMIKTDSNLLVSAIETGRLIDNVFPMSIEVLKSSKEALPAGTKFFGKQIEGKTKIDSISSNSMSSLMKSTLMTAMESIISQVQYPNTKVKVGQSFEQINPFSIPISDMTIYMEINSIYTLKKVENGIGFFDLDQTYLMKSALKEFNYDVNGSGKGQISYDIENKIFTKFELEMFMNLDMEIEGVTLKVELESVSNQLTTIESVNR